VELGRLIPMTEDFGSSRWTVSAWPPPARRRCPRATWHHVAIVASSLAATLYVDGIQVGSGGSSLKFTPNFINNGTTRIDRQVLNYGQQFTGQMDDVRIHAGGLAAQAVEAEYLAGRSVVAAVPEPGSYALFALGLVALRLASLRRRAAAEAVPKC